MEETHITPTLGDILALPPKKDVNSMTLHVFSTKRLPYLI